MSWLSETRPHVAHSSSRPRASDARTRPPRYVGPTHLGGRILASLARGLDDEWATCGLVSDSHDKFPPEPARYAGSIAVRAAVARKERADDAGRRPDRVSRWLAGFAPSGYFKISEPAE